MSFSGVSRVVVYSQGECKGGKCPNPVFWLPDTQRNTSDCPHRYSFKAIDDVLTPSGWSHDTKSQLHKTGSHAA